MCQELPRWSRTQKILKIGDLWGIQGTFGIKKLYIVARRLQIDSVCFSKPYDTKPMALAQTRSPLNDLEVTLSRINVEEILGLPKEIPEPNYHGIDKCLSLVEIVSTFVEEMEEPLSSRDCKYLKNLAVKLIELVEKVDLCIKILEHLPDSVQWKKKADDKLVNLANRIEDIAEVCELAVDEEFIAMISDRLQSYLNARSKN